VLRVVIDEYLNRLNLDIKPDHQVDNLAMAMSLVASTRGVHCCLPMRGIFYHGP